MRGIALLLFGGLIGVVGCAKSGVSGPSANITGKISLQGKPVAGAMVQFIPADKGGVPGSARTDADGHYQLVSAKGMAGVTPGEYKVVISRILGPDGKELPPETSPFSGGGKETLPPFYSKPEDTILTATVAGSGSITIDFPLTGQGGASGGPTGARR